MNPQQANARDATSVHDFTRLPTYFMPYTRRTFLTPTGRKRSPASMGPTLPRMRTGSSGGMLTSLFIVHVI